MYNHYIRLNEAGIIVRGFSSAFEEYQEGDILIMEEGPRLFSEVWSEPLAIGSGKYRGQYRYKWIDEQRVQRSQEELDAEWAAQPPAPPSEQQQMEQRLADVELALADLFTGGGV